MASSPSTSVGGGAGPGAGDVCCMCGDRGLPEELFRCRLCRVRLQHRYCSDLYPRATAYRRCNWCLREPAPVAGGGHAYAVADKPPERRKATSSSSTTDQETSTSGDVERQRLQEAAGCSASRRAPDTGLGRPVKKQKKKAGEGEAPDARAALAKGNGNSKKAMQAGKKTGVKVRVRRYKLLAEVISC